MFEKSTLKSIDVKYFGNYFFTYIIAMKCVIFHRAPRTIIAPIESNIYCELYSLDVSVLSVPHWDINMLLSTCDNRLYNFSVLFLFVRLLRSFFFSSFLCVFCFKLYSIHNILFKIECHIFI